MTHTARKSHAHVPTSSVLLILASVLCFTLLDTTSKFTTRLYPVPVLLWARYAVQLVAMLAWLAPQMGVTLLHTRRPWLQGVRALLLLASGFLFFAALREVPLADATAMTYSSPVIVVLIGVFVLGEHMTRARLAFVAAGAAGMLLIVRPGAQTFQGAALLALGAAACYAVYQILTRVLAGENARVLLFYPALIGTIILSAAAPTFDWPAHMPWSHVALIVMGALFGTAGHFLFILAFRHAPASALTPFTYSQLLWATLMGLIVYGDFPDGATVLGMTVIAVSGLLIALHERRLGARAARPGSW